MATAENREVKRGKAAIKPATFYGWVIVAACFAAMFCVGQVTWSFGVFFPSLEQDFGWSRSLISGGYTLMIVGHSASAIVAGRFADRGLARPVLMGSAVIGGLAITLCSQISAPSQFYLLFLVTGLATGANHSIPSSTVQRWFANRSHAGIALATVTTGIGIGSLLFAPLFRHLISTIGWRPTMVFAGATFCVVVGVAGFLNKPHDSQKPSESGSRLAGEKPEQPSVTTRNILLARQFLILLGVTVVALLSFQVMVIHLVPYANDVGLSPEVAALALGIIGGASIPGRFLCGVVSERLGWGRTLAAALTLGATAMAGLTVATENWMLVCVVILFGMGHGMRAVAVMGLMGRYFGTVVLGELLGITIAVGQLMSAPGPYIAGYWYDISNSYDLMFALLAATLLLGAMVVLRVGGHSERQSSENRM
ncbi:MAG: MFS transporter [Dehalococcoidia bacterium]|nr:MFS transporter [Dehalococcoidia bacterium]